jgi:translation initiation factor 1
MAKEKKRVVFSTDPDFEERCPVCQMKISQCICKKETGKFQSHETIEIRREVKGRGGKSVTVVCKVGGDIKETLKELQKICGVGGSTKQKNIELQGDQRNKVKSYFEEKGRKVKFTGG